MKTPPLGSTASSPAWQAFDRWSTQHNVPDETEDWEYLWECFLAGYTKGYVEAAKEPPHD